MRSIPRAAVVAVVCTIGMTFVQPVPAAAQVYTYQGIADTRPASPFADFGPPSINDAGDIAFSASLKNGGSGIYKWSAATHSLVTIFEDPTTNWLSFHNRFDSPALSPNGTVIFQYEHERIRAGNGSGQPQIVVDESSTRVPLGSLGVFPCLQPMLRSRSTDSAGRAVIRCLIDDGPNARGEGTYLASVGSIERVCDLTSAGLPRLFTRCFTDDWPVEVSGNILAGIGVDVSRFDQFGFPRQLLLRGSAAGLEVLLDPGLNTALAFPNRLSRLAVNEQGNVTYDAYQDTAGGSGYAVFRIDTAGAPTSVTDPRNFVYRDAHLPSINALGEIPFLDGLRNGIFIGPDPILNKVIVRADTIPGYARPGFITSVSAVSFASPGINRRGEIALIAFLGDGTLVVTRVLPPSNHPPDVTFGDQSSPEGTPVTVQVAASDQDGDYPLVYRDLAETPAAVAPAGTLPGPPPGLIIDTSSGTITGIPTPGTSGNRYATRITVEDSRGLSTVVDMVWTITDPLPPPRVNVVASTNVVAEAIDLSWQNPAPDSAEEFWIGYSTTGIAGPFQAYGFGPLSTTSLRFVEQLGSGQTFCFTAKGVVTRNGNRVFSVNSTIACTNYPQFTVSVQDPGVISTPTSATFTITTNMPADLGVLWPTTPPAGAQWSVTPDATHKVFTVQITNLPSGSVETSYSVTVFGSTRLIGLLGNRTVSFVTTAAPGGGGGGGGEVGVSADLLGHVVDVRGTVAGASTAYLDLDVQLTNNAAPASLQRVRAINATVDMYCPPSSGICTDTFITYPLLGQQPYGIPVDVGTIAPDNSSAPLRLTFTVHPAVLQGVHGLFGRTGRLHLDVTYEVPGGSPTSRQVRLDLGLWAPSAPDLEVRSYAGTVNGNAVGYVAEVRNTGNPQLTAGGVELWATIPAGARFDASHSDSACSARPNTDYVVCDAGSMSAFTVHPFSFRIDVASVPAGAVSSIASVRSANDPDDSNNSKVAINAVGPPIGTHTNLAVTIDDQDDPVGMVARGSPNVTYTIVVRNTGPEAAANVRVQLDTFLSAWRSGCFVARQGRPPICDLGDIPAGGSASATIEGHIHVPGLFITIATVTSGAIESDYRDNVDRETTIVQPGFASQ